MHARMMRAVMLPAAVVAAALVGIVPSPSAHAAAPQERSFDQLPQRFTAVATSLEGRRPAAQQVEIRIDHWSTDAQRDEMLAILRDKGEQALLTALQKLPVVGTIRTPDSLAYDLRFARHQPWDDGGEQVIIATDRYISYWEATQSLRSTQYPFTVIQMRVDGNGKGQGRISVATKITAAGNEIVLENYDTQPVALNDVQRQK